MLLKLFGVNKLWHKWSWSRGWGAFYLTHWGDQKVHTYTHILSIYILYINQWIRSALLQIMACSPPNHYLNQCWLTGPLGANFSESHILNQNALISSQECVIDIFHLENNDHFISASMCSSLSVQCSYHLWSGGSPRHSRDDSPGWTSAPSGIPGRSLQSANSCLGSWNKTQVSISVTCIRFISFHCVSNGVTAVLH